MAKETTSVEESTFCGNGESRKKLRKESIHGP
jgi:hypothetical protein